MKNEIPELKKITVTFVCGKCKEEVSDIVDTSDFSSNASECGLCGSHGELEVYVTCPSCNKFTSIELRSW